jgi:hypothetical protein
MFLLALVEKMPEWTSTAVAGNSERALAGGAPEPATKNFL